MKTLSHKFCSLILSFALVLDLHAQIDSLKKVLGFEKEDTNKVNTFIAVGNEYKNHEIYDEAIANLFNALTLSEKINNQESLYKSLYAIANFYMEQSDNEQALVYGLRAQKIAEKINDKEALFRIYDLIGGFIYFNSGKYKESFTYGYKLLQLAKASKDSNQILYMQEWFGDTYRLAKKFDSSRIMYNMALQTARQMNDKEQIANCIHGIGMAYNEQGDYKNGINYYLQSIKFSERAGLPSTNYKHNIAYAYMNMGNYDSALFYANSALAGYKSEGKKSSEIEVYEMMSTIYIHKKNYKDAYLNYRNSVEIKDSIKSIEIQNKINAIQNNYNVEKQNKQIDLLQTKAKLQKTLRDVIIIVLLLVIIISLLLANKYRQSKKTESLMNAKNIQLTNAFNDLKSTQKQLIQSEKMASLGELTAGIAHEIQNPLNFVNNFSEVNNELIEELKSQKSKLKIEEQDEILNDIFLNNEKINHHGKRADAIVKGMLQHSKQTKGIKEPTDINALCDEFFRLSYHGLRAKDKSFNAEIKTDFDETIGKINIVPQDIGRVLLNLINNAFYATNDKKKTAGEKYKPLVSVQTKKINGKIEIKVEDNGSGIPPNIIDKIFQPFFTTKPTGQGTGLGLSLAYDIITKEHGGTIKVESREGEGSMFIIQLPTT